MTRLLLSPSPRWPVLAMLVSVVLGLHLVLLAGGIHLHVPGAEKAEPTRPEAASPHPANNDPDHAPPLLSVSNAAPVHVSTVRWIVPTPAPAATPVAARRSDKPKPVARAAPPVHWVPVEAPAPAETPDTVTVAEAATHEPAPTDTSESAAPPAPQAASAAADAVAVPPLAPEAPAVATDLPSPAETLETAPADSDTLVAAAPASQSTSAVKLPPAQPPGSMRLQYDVDGSIKGLHYKAEGLLDWSVADGRYNARLDMRVMLLGSRSQSSTGRIGPSGLMPERFADKSRSEKAAHFDAAQQRIRFSNNAPEAPLQPGAQDRLSLFMQLAGLLQARPETYASGQTLTMQVAGTGDAPVWRFDIGEESTIRVPAGEFRVRHVARQPRKEFDSTVEMWLAPSLGHMPVRLRITQPNGDVADQKLRQMP
ncbi:DUF3108 domain-containing protein [Hydrogenophaga sp. BPS33]|uniref:DUF3108 domain-containing protein n=1 Tax=Hydrogenophaga sp. BPS33 TaxID=2651974 RepID=UPI0013204FEA|nr:DUF3108 domain-containing protein [Hydrogenophaga sp. BPS33]QHE88335.1 DUF3108 domain-containing protein [Hydrogenophaga sp. BPS33]